MLASISLERFRNPCVAEAGPFCSLAWISFLCSSPFRARSLRRNADSSKCAARGYRICDAILVLRVHAIYDRSRVVLAVLSVLLLAEIGVLVRSAFEVHRKLPYAISETGWLTMLLCQSALNLPPVIREAIGFHGCAVVAPPDRAIRAAFLG